MTKLLFAAWVNLALSVFLLLLAIFMGREPWEVAVELVVAIFCGIAALLCFYRILTGG